MPEMSVYGMMIADLEDTSAREQCLSQRKEQ